MCLRVGRKEPDEQHGTFERLIYASGRGALQVPQQEICLQNCQVFRAIILQVPTASGRGALQVPHPRTENRQGNKAIDHPRPRGWVGSLGGRKKLDLSGAAHISYIPVQALPYRPFEANGLAA